MSADSKHYPAKKGTPPVEVRELGWVSPFNPDGSRKDGKDTPKGTAKTRRTTAPQLGNKGPDHAVRADLIARAAEKVKEPQAPVVAIDCTEPNRDACPRKCMDFCNKAELDKAAPAHEHIKNVVELVRKPVMSQERFNEKMAGLDAADPEPAKRFNAETVEAVVAQAELIRPAPTLPKDITDQVIRNLQGPSLKEQIDGAMAAIKVTPRIQLAAQAFVPVDTTQQEALRVAVIEPVPEALADTDAEYVPPFKSDAPLESIMDDGWRDVLVNNLHAEKDSDTTVELNPRAAELVGDGTGQALPEVSDTTYHAAGPLAGILNDIERDFFKHTTKDPETMNTHAVQIAVDEDLMPAPAKAASVDAMAAHVQSIAAQDTRTMDIPKDWTFHNKSVADNFDKHVREQLPWYDLATGIVSHFGRHYLPENGTMYDIGASTGNVTLMLKNEIEKRKVSSISLDNSEQMADVWRGIGKFQVADVRNYPYEQFDFAVCFLLLMFLPPADQRDFVMELYRKLKPGGALVIFDKTDKFTGYMATVVHRLTMAGKVATGVPADEIVRKELSLAGIQRPIDVAQLLFHDIGAVEVFRFGEFAGWVITK